MNSLKLDTVFESSRVKRSKMLFLIYLIVVHVLAGLHQELGRVIRGRNHHSHLTRDYRDILFEARSNMANVKMVERGESFSERTCA